MNRSARSRGEPVAGGDVKYRVDYVGVMKRVFTVLILVAVTVGTLFAFTACNKKYDYFEVPTKSYAEGEEFLYGCGNYNNGYDKESGEVDRLISVVPSDGKWKLIGDSTVIGNRRILMFEDAPVSDVVSIVLRQSRSVPVLRSVSLYA